jgi:hypothetical protein
MSSLKKGRQRTAPDEGAGRQRHPEASARPPHADGELLNERGRPRKKMTGQDGLLKKGDKEHRP